MNKAVTDRVESIRTVLCAAGFVEYTRESRHGILHFYKIFETPTRCAVNQDKSGVQVCCRIHNTDLGMPESVSVSINLSAGLPDGTWIELHQWALPEDVTQALGVIPRLLSTWEHVANI